MLCPEAISLTSKDLGTNGSTAPRRRRRAPHRVCLLPPPPTHSAATISKGWMPGCPWRCTLSWPISLMGHEDPAHGGGSPQEEGYQHGCSGGSMGTKFRSEPQLGARPARRARERSTANKTDVPCPLSSFQKPEKISKSHTHAKVRSSYGSTLSFQPNLICFSPRSNTYVETQSHKTWKCLLQISLKPRTTLGWVHSVFTKPRPPVHRGKNWTRCWINFLEIRK